MTAPKTVPLKVIEGVAEYAHDAQMFQQILQAMEYSHIQGCYFFHSFGMYVGVEMDGYVHT